MPSSPRQPEPDQPDMIDQVMENPYVHAAASRLQRFLGPSCLISLVLYAILIILFKRWVHLPPAGLVMLLMVVWGIVLGIGVRFRNPNPDDD
mgnify:CR=1 FL=1